MEIQVTWSNGLPTALLPLESGSHELICLSPLQTLGADLDRFLNPVLARFNLLRVTSARLRLRHLAQLGEAMQAKGCRELPKSEATWQALILGVHHFIHTRQDRQQSLQTRHGGIWKSARRTFKILADEGVIPSTVHIPPALSRLVFDQRSEQLLGDSDPVEVDNDIEVNKLLVAVSLARTDAAYLDEIRDSLVTRRQVLFQSLVDYWKKLRRNLDFGRDLRASVDEKRFTELTFDALTGEYSSPDPTASLEHLGAYLTYLDRYCDGSPHRARGNLAATRWEKHRFSLPTVANWPIAGSLPPTVDSLSETSTGYKSMWTWLGRLSGRDVSVIVPLLIMLHPQWTPTALAEASITDRDGKIYIDLEEGGLGFEVEKHRAKAMKRSVLCELSEEILTTVLEHSAALRRRLAAENHPFSKRLFLPYGKVESHGTVSVSAPPSDLSLFIARRSHRRNHWLGDFYPSVVAAGLSIGTINCRKIRATESVLEWFRTKSLRAAAKRIGNSERVVLEHYIPTAILNAWNTRCVRRFQNLWITVAAAHEPFLLDVTDFSSLGDLNTFISDLLQLHGPKSSPLAAELHLRLASNQAAPPFLKSGELHVSLSTVSLTALYRYSAAALRAGISIANFKPTESASGASSGALVQLADLLQIQLPLDRNSDYRRMHEEAMLEAANPQKIEQWLCLFRTH